MTSNAEIAMKHKDLITRYLDGLTSPKEECQLRDMLEAKSSLSEEERAVLNLLRLSFPEEDTAALLTEDQSADFEAMTAQTDCSRVTKSSSFFTVHSSLFIRHFTAVLSIAAVLLIAFLLWPESNKDTSTQPEVQPVVAEANPRPIPPPVIEEKKEEVLAEVQPKKKPVKKRRKAVRKQSTSIEEPLLAEAEPVTEVPARDYSDVKLSDPSNPYQLAVAQLQDLRSRGERLDREVAMLMQH